MMFRRNGMGELYAYFPQIDSNREALAKVKPKVVESGTYGTSVGRGSFKWVTGACECAVAPVITSLTNSNRYVLHRDIHRPAHQA